MVHFTMVQYYILLRYTMLCDSMLHLTEVNDQMTDWEVRMVIWIAAKT